MAVIQMLRVEAWVLLPNALKRLASTIVVWKGALQRYQIYIVRIFKLNELVNPRPLL